MPVRSENFQLATQRLAHELGVMRANECGPGSRLIGSGWRALEPGAGERAGVVTASLRSRLSGSTGQRLSGSTGQRVNGLRLGA